MVKVFIKTSAGSRLQIEVSDGDVLEVAKLQSLRYNKDCQESHVSNDVSLTNHKMAMVRVKGQQAQEAEKVHEQDDDLQTKQEISQSPRISADLVAVKIEPDVSIADVTVTSAGTVVQFDAPNYYCSEGEDTMKIDVIRIGDLSKATEVYYRTKDRTAKAGQKYVHTEGTLLFHAGDHHKCIEVPLVNDDHWDSTLEFGVELLEEGLVGAVLGRYLWCARVSIIDNDVFPTNRYGTLLLKKDWENQVSSVGLMLQYCKLTFRNPVVHKGTLKIVASDTCRNAYMLLNMFAQVYLVDEILTPRSSSGVVQHMAVGGGRKANLLLLVAITWSSFFIIHLLDYRQETWRVGGGARAMLQGNLLRKFLNYCQESRSDLVPGGLIMAITKDAAYLVKQGYCGLLDVLHNIARLLCIMIFQACIGPVFGKNFPAAALSASVMFAVVLLTVLKLRQACTSRVLRACYESQTEFVDDVVSTVSCYPLIADYRLRGKAITRCEEKIQKYNFDAIQAGKLLTNNKYLAKHLCMAIVFIYTMYGSLRVIETPEEYSLGGFLVNLGALKAIGDYWVGIYKELEQMQTALPSLVRIVNFMNRSTDMDQRMQFNRRRRSETCKLMEQFARAGVASMSIDKLQIRVEKFRFAPSLINLNSKVCIDQGRLVCLIGPHSEGKSSLLRYLGNATLPEFNCQGKLFIPSHLQCLHVSRDPVFYPGTLMQNLTFGVRPGHQDGCHQRVLKICSVLGLKEHILSFENEAWMSRLSAGEAQLLSIARALISNPEMICIHHPTAVLNDASTILVMRALRRYVRNRGVCVEKATNGLRRPRTCVFTSARSEVAQHADLLIHVDNSGAHELLRQELDMVGQLMVKRLES